MNPSKANASTAQPEASEEAGWRHRARHYGPAFQEAYVRYLSGNDASQLPALATGLLKHHVEHVTDEWLARRGGQLNLQTDLGADSIALAEVAFAAEELFDVNFTNAELASLRTIDDLTDIIKAKRQCT